MVAILIIAIIIILIIWLNEKKRLGKVIEALTSELFERKNSLKNSENKLRDLQSKADALSRYEGILDAESKAREVISDAEKMVEVMIREARQELETAKKQAKELKTKTNDDVAALKASTEKIFSQASDEAKRIVDEAKRKAEGIDGSAFISMEKADHFEKTATAMKNVIEGYGDQYLVPTYSLLDDLALEFTHIEAGVRLQLARERTRLLIKDNSAAFCEYVETNRKETAVNFVLDAFNGKVDSILSKIKKDNYGILEQQVRDALQIVNNNGKAFRNAQITDQYLLARLDELKWAVIVQELKFQEQEEQRRIKEQIREEERARKEYEKAMRDAEKEEETLKKLIEKAQSEVSQATEEQRSKYEKKLTELELKLKVAEEKVNVHCQWLNRPDVEMFMLFPT